MDEMLDSPDVAGEVKIDGCHYNIINNGFFSTSISKSTGFPVDKTENFPHLVKILEELNYPNMILDGEIFIPGKTSQYVTRITGSNPDRAFTFQQQNEWVKYKLWDILRTPKGTWMHDMPYIKRRDFLERFFNEILDPLQKSLGADYFELVEMRIHDKREFLDEIYDDGGEGMVLKKLDSKYEFGKKPKWEWMKCKQSDEIDAVIMGTNPPTRLYTGKNIENWEYWENDEPVTEAYSKGWIGAVVVGQFDANGTLTPIATISGMTNELREDLSTNFEKYENRVVKVGFMEYTTDGNLRHPHWQGLHPDKNPTECLIET